MSTDIEWKDDGFFIHIKARDMASGEFYWRRAELGDCKLVISSLRQEVETLREALEFAREWATGLGQVSFDDRAAFVAQIDRVLRPKDKP